MSRFLIAYSTTDGHTPRICERLQHVIEGQGHAVTVVPLADAEALDLNGFDRIVLGASIRYGKHQPQVAQFIARHHVTVSAARHGIPSPSLLGAGRRARPASVACTLPEVLPGNLRIWRYSRASSTIPATGRSTVS